MNKAKGFFLALLLVFSFVFVGCAGARPPKPGLNFVWVPKHRTVDGRIIPGHWKYVGPKVTGRHWVPGHFNRMGIWVPGHWSK